MCMQSSCSICCLQTSTTELRAISITNNLSRDFPSTFPPLRPDQDNPANTHGLSQIKQQKPACAGCGNHVPRVMDSVPTEQWCTCTPKQKIEGKEYPPRAGEGTTAATAAASS
ncbi:predicted protein [Histoplasma mississippiense (nom. inval.)]|uniref:predicted protein n=1 Tax=Ajellomyces capsulatus (strain NAm1 / WU24) TaxID=2059318 RepID=UPI000157BE79|nr:predicted protein [Histoplasma mississippiense (nom. inval.)]EDN07142.1 predicted protein [Histoplasma mississippiense (nom. inval.)]